MNYNNVDMIKCCEDIKDEKRTVQTLWDSFGEPDAWPGEEPNPQKGIRLAYGLNFKPRIWRDQALKTVEL